jgi:sporulation protein YlmC with PRC-barrel domain
MAVLMRAKDIIKRPVVTLAGDDVAQIKDIVYTGDHGEVAGFTLAGRGLLAGPRKEALAWTSIRAMGQDAVIITSEDSFDKRGDVVHKSEAKGDVMASRVISDTGTDLGKVVDAVLDIGDKAHVVGYEIEASEALGRAGRKVLIPLPDTISVSGEALIVPDSASEFVSDDMAEFDASIQAFRARLRGGQQ